MTGMYWELLLKVQRNLPAVGGKCPPQRGLHFTTSYLEDALELFHQAKKLAERAMEQVTDEQLFAPLDPETNSIAARESLSEVDPVRTVTHSRRTPFGHASCRPPGGALCASFRTGRSAGKTLRRPQWKSLSVPRN
jgi:hypothetical protein